MATEPKNQNLTGRHRQVLEILAIAPHGRDVNALLTLGFKLETMADLVRSELATVRVEIVEERDSKIEFAIVEITDAGWGLLEGLTARRLPPLARRRMSGLWAQKHLAATGVDLAA
jgi:hypothetical protein